MFVGLVPYLGEGGPDVTQGIGGSPLALIEGLWWLNLLVALIVVTVVPQADLFRKSGLSDFIELFRTKVGSTCSAGIINLSIEEAQRVVLLVVSLK